MRLVKAEELIVLAFALESTRQGLALTDIQERFSVSRRTAERMRDSIERLFPALEQANPGELPKRWRLPATRLHNIGGSSVAELASLDTAAGVLKRENMPEHAARLELLSLKLRAQLNSREKLKFEPDLEALMEAEGLAMRPGPRPVIDTSVMHHLRLAILSCWKVRLHYVSRGTQALSRQIVCPYGFLYGNRHYLVAYSMNPEVRDYRLYSLANINKVDVTKLPFERRKDFSLREFSERSFGVFQEEPSDIVLRFLPSAASDARNFLFHPTQSMEERDDGSLVVKFRAGGLREMAWHLYTWGTEVEVIEPEPLQHWVSKVQRTIQGLDVI